MASARFDAPTLLRSGRGTMTTEGTKESTQAAPAAPPPRPLVIEAGDIAESCKTGTEYSLRRLLGIGGFGQVWQATVRRGGAVGETRALKIMYAHDAEAVADEVMKQRLAVEKAGQSYIPQLFESTQARIGNREDIIIVAMELVEGCSAGKLARCGMFVGHEMPEKCALVILSHVNRALSRLHNAGVIHRDVKGDNVLVGARGEVKLADFGISAVVSELSGSTEVCGTPAYMAPEVCFGKHAGAPSDIWAFGIMAIELSHAGNHPWVRVNMDGGIMHYPKEYIFDRVKAAATLPKAPNQLADLSIMYEDMVSDCLVRDPAKRPTAGELGMYKQLQLTNQLIDDFQRYAHRQCNLADQLL